MSSSAVAYRDYQLRAVGQVDRPPAGVLPEVRRAGRQGIRSRAEGVGFEPTRTRHHAPNTVGNFCFEVTLGYRRLERGR